MAKKRRYWSKLDRAILRRMATRKPAKVIAQRLRRTENATRQKAFELGVSLESRHWRYRYRPEPVL